MEVLLLVISWTWWLVNWPTNALIGDNIFDLLLEALYYLMVVGLLALPLSGIAALVARLFRRRVNYLQVVATMLIMLLVPHLYMSWQLRNLKLDFKTVAAGPHGEDFSDADFHGGGTFEYGGKLDRMVGERVRLLAAHQYIPYFTARWEVQSIGIITVPGAYIYTFLPKSWYDGLLYLVTRAKPADRDDYQAWLAGIDIRHGGDVYLDEKPYVALAPSQAPVEPQITRPAVYHPQSAKVSKPVRRIHKAPKLLKKGKRRKR